VDTEQFASWPVEQQAVYLARKGSAELAPSGNPRLLELVTKIKAIWDSGSK